MNIQLTSNQCPDVWCAAVSADTLYVHRLHTGLCLTAASAGLALFLAPGIAQAQTPHVRRTVETVPLTVTVRDRGGRHVTDLNRDDFELYENGRAQAISLFERDRVPITLTVVLDASRSMATDIEGAKTIVNQLLDLLRPGDLGSIIDCSASVRQPPTADVDVLRRTVSDIVVRGTTALYDSMSLATQLATTDRRAAQHGTYQHVMVVVSDGVDTSSTTNIDAVLARFRARGTVVYVVRPTRTPPAATGRIAQHLDGEYLRTLRRVADATGGDLLVTPVAGRDYSAVRTRIGRALSSTYLLAYSPSTPAAPEARVTVRLKRRGLRIHATRLAPPANLVGILD